MPELTTAQLAAMIDHTLLKPEAGSSQVDDLCREALEHRFASVCINSVYVDRAADQLRGSGVKVCTVNGFPLGASLTAAKVCEAVESVVRGASEIDMVLAIGRLKSNRDDEAYADVLAVTDACHERGALVKVIIETCLLSDEEKVRACRLAQAAGADFVKTSTGFSSGGATEADVRLMRATVGPDMGVKAAGGIRTLAQARSMLAAGANRIGASAGVAILRELEAEH